MYDVRVIIPKMTGEYKIYVYRSRKSEDIDTIDKILHRQPVFIIDEKTAHKYYYTHPMDEYQHYFEINADSYLVLDTDINYNIDEEYANSIKYPEGVEYFGPRTNSIPTNEYETSIDVIHLNDNTYMNKLTLNMLPPLYNGIVYYYSCIGVDEPNNLITHLCKPTGIIVKVPYSDGIRHIYSCDNYEDKDTDVWNYVCNTPFYYEINNEYIDEIIIIGDIDDTEKYEKYGIPIVETIPIFKTEDISINKKYLYTNSFIVLNLPNIWQHNNKTYNYRKLKSYKIQTEYNGNLSDFSIPTYQSLVPVSIEKMVILQKEGTYGNVPIDFNTDDPDVQKYEIIRQGGLYYNKLEHLSLSVNQYNIPIEENTAIFNERSVQKEIKKQISVIPGHRYTFTIYLVDVYNKVSEPILYYIEL